MKLPFSSILLLAALSFFGSIFASDTSDLNDLDFMSLVLFNHDAKLLTDVSNGSSLNSFLAALRNGTNSQSITRESCLEVTRQSNLSFDRRNQLCDILSLSGCQRARQMLQFKKGESTHLANHEVISRICPVILRRLDTEECSFDSPSIQSNKPSIGSVWGFAVLSVTIISLTSLVGVAIVPFLNQNSYTNVINFFEGLAVGSLLGSAIFHLIPQSFELMLDHELKHVYLWKALVIFGGIYMFYWSERIMNIIVQIKDEKQSSTNNTPNEIRSNGAIDSQSRNHAAEIEMSSFQHGPVKTDFEQRIRSVSDSITHTHSHGHDHRHPGSPGERKIATVAWMIIFGDGLHNFIDGLSIGAAFQESILTGVSICIAVVCEEFPHELGDFAVLIASGMSVKQAVGYNFLSACTWFVFNQ